MSILDETDRGLLGLLQKNDRLSLAEIGQELKLAPSTVNDRIKRLVRNEIISGFHAAVNPEKVGLDLLAFVFVGWNDPGVEAIFLKKVAETGAVLECHHVTGAWNYLLKVRLKNTRELERFLAHHGNPFARIGSDEVSKVQFALGSSGYPESFIVDARGVIRYQHIGEIRPDQIEMILTKLKEAEQ